MYFVALFPVPPLDEALVDALLATALDADQPQPARVAAFHRLRGCAAPRRSEVARALVAVLNEHTNWIGSEAALCIEALAPKLVVGVRAGLVVAVRADASPPMVDDDGQLHDAELGEVAPLSEMASLVRAPSLPWLARHDGFVVATVDGARRTYRQHQTFDFAEAAGESAAQIVIRASDVVVTALRGRVVVGADSGGRALVGAVTTTRALPRDVITVGARTWRYHRVVQPAHLAGAPPVEVRIDNGGNEHIWRARVGDARALGEHLHGAHAAVLGPREVAVVSLARPDEAAFASVAAEAPVVAGRFPFAPADDARVGRVGVVDIVTRGGACVLSLAR